MIDKDKLIQSEKKQLKRDDRVLSIAIPLAVVALFFGLVLCVLQIVQNNDYVYMAIFLFIVPLGFAAVFPMAKQAFRLLDERKKIILDNKTEV